jgi:sensor c-di-GMP phosphodiesterase-like protein
MRTPAACWHTIASTSRSPYHISMGVPLAVAIGLSLAAALVIAQVVWRIRRHRYSTPASRYLREVRGIKMGTYQQVQGPGYTRQVGNPPGYVGGTGPPVGF